MSVPWEEWDHILKLDPDKDLPPDTTYKDVCESGTDAIEIGGTTGITNEKMATVIEACAKYDVPLYQEPSSPGVVLSHDDLDGHMVPIVLNTPDTTWVLGAHKEWIKHATGIDWQRTWTEAYIVLNPDSAVAEYTSAQCDLSANDVAAYAITAEHLLGQEIVYIEYSGTYGDPEIVRSAHRVLEDSHLFYGGGISGYDTAYEMRSSADTVVVGNILYEEGVSQVIETVNGAKDAGA